MLLRLTSAKHALGFCAALLCLQSSLRAQQPTPAQAPAPAGGQPGQAATSDAEGPAGFLGPGTPATVAGIGSAFGILAGRPLIRPVRAVTPPVIDGRLGDQVWRTAATIKTFVQQAPLDGAPATEATEVRVAYDSQFIYLGFHVRYADTTLMRANRADRDQAIEDDLITVYFDPFRDQQRAFMFEVNAYGVQGDGIITTNPGSGGGNQALPIPDRTFDALFQSVGRIVDDGFTAEMSIPFKSLRYPSLDGKTPQRWGFQVVRSIKGKDSEVDVWAPVSRSVSGFMTQMGVLEGMSDISTRRNLELLPTFTGIRFGSLNTKTGAFTSGWSREAGVDFKYGITSNLTFNLTYNPDFSQIESDRAQIDVNQRFPLLYPELRPFFIEGREIFTLSSPVTWINTRTIVDPRYGAKLTGKVGNLAIGLLAANDEAPGKRAATSDPAFGESAQVFIARARYDLYAESYMGGLVTDREFLDGHSRAAGIDGQFRIGQTARLNYIAFDTMNRKRDGTQTSGAAWGVFLQRNGRNLRLSSFTGSNDPDAATEVGFFRRANTQNFWHTGSYRWWPEKWITNWGPRGRYERLYNHDWTLEDEKIESGLDFTFARNITASVGTERSLERYRNIDFRKWRYNAKGNVATSRRITVGGSVDWGDQISFTSNPFLGHGATGSLDVILRPMPRFQSQLSVDTSQLEDVRTGKVEVFDIKLFRALTTYQFTQRLLIRNILDLNTFTDTLGVNLLATYRVNAGTVFFLGYDDHYQQLAPFDQTSGGLVLNRALERTNRAVFTKLQVLFRL